MLQGQPQLLPGDACNGSLHHGSTAQSGLPRLSVLLQALANNFGTFAAVMPPVLNSIDLIHRVVGPKPLEFISRNLNKMSGNMIPVWSPSIPKVCPYHCHPAFVT